MPNWVDYTDKEGTMKEIDASWLACAVDGEGYVGLYIRGRKYPVVEIGVTNTNLDFIKRVVEIVGGSIDRQSFRNGFGIRRKVVYQARIKGHSHVLYTKKFTAISDYKKREGNGCDKVY